MQQRTDSYLLKNASWPIKIISTLTILGSITLLAWSWYVSLSVLKIHRPSNLCVTLGDDLWALAHYKTNLFALIFFYQACAYAGIYFVSRFLFRRTSLRRRMKTFILLVVDFLVVLNELVWITAPLIRFSQQLAGYIGLVSGAALVMLTLPPIFQMWFYKRWRHQGIVTHGNTVRVVIVGGGFAGLYTALDLDKMLGYHRHLEIVLIDQKNFFLFPPLLPSAAVGTIETRQVTYSYRRIFETTNVRYQKAKVTAVDPKDQTVTMHVHLEETDMGKEPTAADVKLHYDYLVLAPGSTNQTFNTKGAEEYAIFVKELPDAMKIRNRIIDCFERAAVIQDETIRRELLRFAVVGGGPTGIEIATEIRDLIHEVLIKRYPEVHHSWPEVCIIQSGPQILPGWPEKVVKTSTVQLHHVGIKLILNNRVTEVRPNAVVLKEGPPVAARTILWCAGVQPSPLMKSTGLPVDKSGRAPVDGFLRPQGFENIFVLGDSASTTDPKTGKLLPPLGQVAFQQGSHMAKNLVHALRREPLEPFQYFNFGALVSVGEHYAAVNLLGIRLTGFLGWFVWRSLYLSKIVGISNKLRIMIDWTLDLLIERSIAQLQDDSHETHTMGEKPAELAGADTKV